MKIDRFNELLKVKYPEAEASYDGSAKAKFYITYRPGGKMYFYKGAIHDIAEKLELIPEVDILAESHKAAVALMENNFVDAPSGCSDTVRYLLREHYHFNREGMFIRSDFVSKDQDDREISRLSWEKRSW